jgi:hypothetical protein
MSEVRFIPGKYDGDLDEDISGRVYLQLSVFADAKYEGSLTGWYPPLVIERIKVALGLCPECNAPQGKEVERHWAGCGK